MTLEYLRLTGRSDEQIALVEDYSKTQKLWHDADNEAVYSEYLELDLSTVVPSIAGPKRPQDRIILADAKAQFEKDLTDYAEVTHDLVDLEAPSPSRPPTRPATRPRTSTATTSTTTTRTPKSASKPTKVDAADGASYTLDHGAVTIAAITSCTNTSNRRSCSPPASSPATR